ncbi:hypothetical protein GQ44DRAFT_757347 [Phaeosphaeriaceae sp. PMI808]|nr:hypothetical protein GQ44DRAFT_757347 [Phaeosphaeriaceae sp. PMI808]
MGVVRTLFELSARSTENSTASVTAPVHVICAFPVSGQYGPGSRILYYVLVITSIFARKAEWLRTPSLAAALVIPAVASIHSIVLASTHVLGAVDLDIFGAFQFCSIAILAAPLTVRLSRTYFYDPGRNIIFLWTILILAGLVALCVEFYRITPTDCGFDNAGKPILNARSFPYGGANCSLTCSESEGPFSPLRGGAANEIFVIPVPNRLTFNAGMLLAAACCIPAILGLVFTWDKILEINWKRRREAENLNEPIEGANVTVGELRGINSVVRMFLSVVEIPIFGGAVLAILGIGEANFFSTPIRYQTEPIASVGQWAPIAGTVLAAIGSLYLIWFKEEKLKDEPAFHRSPSSFSQRELGSDRDPSPIRALDAQRSPGLLSDGNALGISSLSVNEMRLAPTITEPNFGRANTGARQDQEEFMAGRKKIRHWFTSAANYLGNAAHQKLDVSDYNDQKAHRFPEVPGETLRNPALERISLQYSQLREQNSRAGSTYAPSITSTRGLEGGSTPPMHASPRQDTRNYLGNAVHQKLDVSDYNGQKAHRFPEVPGETLRNPAIERISLQYSQLREQNSRVGSTYAPSITSTRGLEGGSTPPMHASPRQDTSPSRKPQRRDTLEVPTPTYIHRRAESH